MSRPKSQPASQSNKPSPLPTASSAETAEVKPVVVPGFNFTRVTFGARYILTDRAGTQKMATDLSLGVEPKLPAWACGWDIRYNPDYDALEFSHPDTIKQAIPWSQVIHTVPE